MMQHFPKNRWGSHRTRFERHLLDKHGIEFGGPSLEQVIVTENDLKRVGFT
jgi:hypothetical protein